MIKLRNVNLTFDAGKTYALKNVTLDIFDNEILAIIGQSGGGKSSLLKIIIGLTKPSSGSIIIDDIDIKNIKSAKLYKLFGYVFQDASLFPHMTVAENISIVLRLQKKSKMEQLNKATELLRSMDLEPNKYSNRYPEELSGGELQRVAIARALVNNPKYLFMDEPFSAIDSIRRSELHSLIRNLKEEFKKTVVFITHNVYEALGLADRIAIFSDGKLEQIDKVNKVLSSPANQYVEKILLLK